MGQGLPRKYELLLEKFKTAARLTKKLYKDTSNRDVSESQMEKTAKACHDLARYYYKVCDEELQRLHGSEFLDAEDTPEPLILEDIRESTLRQGPMKMAKRKEGIFQQIIRNPDPDAVRSLSLSLSEFMKTRSGAVDGQRPVIRWIENMTNTNTEHMGDVYTKEKI